MKAIILAAGRGSRMKSLTDECPKCLVALHGKPLLEWQLAALRAAGISEIGVVTGYKREMLADRGLIEFNNPQWSETNMVTSLACAESWLTTGPVIVSYSDIFYESSAVNSLINCEADIAVTYDPKWLDLWKRRFGDPLVDAETFKLGNDHNLVEIGNRPKALEEVQGQYMGLLRFTPRGWSEVMRIRSAMGPQVQDKMHMTGTLQKIIESELMKVKAVAYDGTWGEIDSTDDLSVYSSN